MTRSRSRWSLFLTRLAIAAIALLLAGMFRVPLMERALKSSLREVTGCEWDFRITQLDPGSGLLQLNDLRIVPPGADVAEAILADSANLEVLNWGVLDNQMVIRRMSIHGARSSSLDRLAALDLGQLWSDSPAGLGLEAVSNHSARTSSTRQWLDSCVTVEPEPLKLDAADVARSIVEEWKQPLQEQAAAIALVDALLRSLPPPVAVCGDNPLRQSSGPATQQAALERIAAEKKLADQMWQSLRERRQRDLARMQEARERDLAAIGAPRTVAGFQANDDHANRALLLPLGDRLSVLVATWGKSVRDSLVASSRPVPPPGRRKVRMAGTPVRPRFVIEQLELDGHSRMGDQHMEFVVSLRNLSDRIDLLQSPLEMELRGQGENHLMARAGFRSATEGWIEVSCPSYPAESIVMGGDSTLDLVATPGELALTATIRFAEGQLSGDLATVHRIGGLQLRQLHPLLQSRIRVPTLTGELAGLDSFSASFQFVETGDAMQCQVLTGPGAALHLAMRNHLEQATMPGSGASAAGIDSAIRATTEEIDTALALCERKLQEVAELQNRAQVVIQQTASRDAPERLR